jgi:hypothetical protein
MAEPVSEEQPQAYFKKGRNGVPAWLSNREGQAATLADMCQHNSERFLIADQGFSAMTESFRAEQLMEDPRLVPTARTGCTGAAARIRRATPLRSYAIPLPRGPGPGALEQPACVASMASRAPHPGAARTRCRVPVPIA